MIETNPYQTPSTRFERNVASASASPVSALVLAERLRVTAMVLGFLYPLWFVGIFYLVYLLGWIELGYPPVANRDIPQNIIPEELDGLKIPLVLLWCTILSFPVCSLASFASVLVSSFATKSKLLICAYSIVVALAFLAFHFAPAGAMGWVTYFD